METHKGPLAKVRWYWKVVKNGLFLFGARNRLALIGFDIDPVYWVLEGAGDCSLPKIKGDASEYLVEHLDFEELRRLCERLKDRQAEELLKGFKNGQMCICLRHKNDIAAFMFIALNDIVYKGSPIDLKPNEAYLLNMYTFETYRGKNLAPYLRYQSYQFLKEMGKDRLYSISAYFNKSSIKFKEKLNAKHLNLILFILLFKKYQWRINLKTYK